MVTQTELRTRTRQQTVRESESRRQEKIREQELEKLYEEELKKQKANVIQPNRERLNAEVVLQEKISESLKSPGVIKATKVAVVEEAFQKAGYPKGYGEAVFISKLRQQPEWTEKQAKAYSQFLKSSPKELGGMTYKEVLEQYEASLNVPPTMEKSKEFSFEEFEKSRMTPAQRELVEIGKKGYAQNVELYKSAGYSTEEARRLAEESVRKQQTPSPQQAADILKKEQKKEEYKQVKKEIFSGTSTPMGLLKGAKLVTRDVASAIDVGTEKLIGFNKITKLEGVYGKRGIGATKKEKTETERVGDVLQIKKEEPLDVGNIFFKSVGSIASAIPSSISTGIGLVTSKEERQRMFTTTSGLGFERTYDTYYGGIYYKPLSPSKTPFEIIGKSAALASGLLIGYGITKGIQLKGVETRRIVTKPDVSPLSFGIVKAPTKPRIVSITKEGKPAAVEYYDVMGISQSAKEGSKLIVTSKFRKALGLKPIYEGVPYTAPKAYQKALKLLKQKGYTSSQAKQILRYRKPYSRSDVFKGETRVTIIEEEAPRVEILGFEKAKYKEGIEKGFKLAKPESTGALVSTKGIFVGEGKQGYDIYKFLEKRKGYFISKEGRKYNKLTQVGKTEETYDILTGIKEIKDLDRFTVFKDVKVSQRINPPQRKVDFGEGIIVVEKGEPPITITDTSVQKAVGFAGGKRKSSEQFLQEMFKFDVKAKQKAISATISPMIKTKITTPKIITPKTQEVITPIISKSAYAGTGLYERTEETTGQFSISRTGQIQTGIGLSDIKVDERFKQVDLLVMGVGLKTKEDTTTIQKIIPRAEYKIRTDLLQSQQQKQEILQIQKTIQKQEQKQLQKQLQKPIQRATTKQTQKINIKPIKTIPVLKSSSSKASISSYLSRRKKTPAFEVQIKRRGKFVTVSKKPLSYESALKLGAQKVSTTLSQRFRLLPKGLTEEQTIGYKLPSQIFTIPKKPTSRIEYVERRGKTLKIGSGEVPEIMRERRAKARRIRVL